VIILIKQLYFIHELNNRKQGMDEYSVDVGGDGGVWEWHEADGCMAELALSLEDYLEIRLASANFDYANSLGELGEVWAPRAASTVVYLEWNFPAHWNSMRWMAGTGNAIVMGRGAVCLHGIWFGFWGGVQQEQETCIGLIRSRRNCSPLTRIVLSLSIPALITTIQLHITPCIYFSSSPISAFGRFVAVAKHKGT